MRECPIITEYRKREKKRVDFLDYLLHKLGDIEEQLQLMIHEAEKDES